MQIKIKKLKKEAVTPTRGSDYSAGYDLCSCLSGWIQPHTTLKIPTGISLEIPNGYFGAIYARSGLATKQGLRPANCVGICDCDYRGEYIVVLHNDTDEAQFIDKGDRIAQLVIQKHEDIEFVETYELSDTQRGEGGFNSTGR